MWTLWSQLVFDDAFPRFCEVIASGFSRRQHRDGEVSLLSRIGRIWTNLSTAILRLCNAQTHYASSPLDPRQLSDHAALIFRMQTDPPPAEDKYKNCRLLAGAATATGPSRGGFPSTAASRRWLTRRFGRSALAPRTAGGDCRRPRKPFVAVLASSRRQPTRQAPTLPRVGKRIDSRLLIASGGVESFGGSRARSPASTICCFASLIWVVLCAQKSWRKTTFQLSKV